MPRPPVGWKPTLQQEAIDDDDPVLVSVRGDRVVYLVNDTKGLRSNPIDVEAYEESLIQDREE